MIDQIYRTNPNKVLAEIEATQAAISEDGDLSRLLNLLWFAIEDEEEVHHTGRLAESTATIRPVSEPPDNQPLTDLSVYTPVDQQRADGWLQSPAHRVLALLRHVYKPGFSAVNHEEDLAEEQALNLEDDDEIKEPVPARQKPRAKSALVAERNILLHYLRGSTNHLTQLVDDKMPVDLTTLARYLIALKLILEYGGKVMVTLPEENGRVSLKNRKS